MCNVLCLVAPVEKPRIVTWPTWQIPQNQFGRRCTRNKTGTSQVGAIPKAQIKSKGDPLETKLFQEKVVQCRKNRKNL